MEKFSFFIIQVDAYQIIYNIYSLICSFIFSQLFLESSQEEFMHFIKEAEEAILAQKRAEEEAEVTRMYDSLYQMLIALSLYI